MEGAAMSQKGINVLALIKGEERYVFLYDDRSTDKILQTLGNYAADPDLRACWGRAARARVADFTVDAGQITGTASGTVGVAASGFSLSGAVTLTLSHDGFDVSAQGLNLTIGGLTLFFNGVIAIYIAKIFIEVKHRPRSIIKDVYCRADSAIGTDAVGTDTDGSLERIQATNPAGYGTGANFTLRRS